MRVLMFGILVYSTLVFANSTLGLAESSSADSSTSGKCDYSENYSDEASSSLVTYEGKEHKKYKYASNIKNSCQRDAFVALVQANYDFSRKYNHMTSRLIGAVENETPAALTKNTLRKEPSNNYDYTSKLTNIFQSEAFVALSKSQIKNYSTYKYSNKYKYASQLTNKFQSEAFIALAQAGFIFNHKYRMASQLTNKFQSEAFITLIQVGLVNNYVYEHASKLTNKFQSEAFSCLAKHEDTKLRVFEKPSDKYKLALKISDEYSSKAFCNLAKTTSLMTLSTSTH